MRINKKRQVEARIRQYSRNHFGRYLFFIVLGLFVIFIGRFFYVSVFHRANGKNLTAMVQKLYAKETMIPAKRGTIYDAEDQPIAEDTTTYSVYIVLSKEAVNYGKKEYLPSSQKEKAAQVLSKNLSMSYTKVLRAINMGLNQHLYQVELGTAGKNISLETKKRIQAAKVPGIKFTAQQNRLYPNGIFASHLIGITKSKDGDLTGITGLEKQYNRLLKGENGVKKSSAAGQGLQGLKTAQKEKPAKNGDNIYTTINPQLQTYLETLMSKADETYHPENINAVLMDAKTGAIKAASQRPTYNAQTREGMDKMWRNTLLEDAYEPGSTMKAFTVAAAIDSGHFNPNEYYRSGTYSIDGSKITDWNPSGWGYISYAEAFFRSSNVGMAHLEEKMGSKTWLQYIKKFGFLKSTNSGLGDEAQGSIQYQYPIDSANTSYGQGINVTVLQMLQAYTAIANNGKMIKPRLIDKIVDPNTGKTVYQSHTTTVGKPIKASTAAKVRELMEGVVYEKNGTGKSYQIDGYKVAVKTGTAQIASTDGGYQRGGTNYIFSVAGIAPADNPRYILYVTVKKPKTFAGQNEGQMVASIFNPLMKQALDEDTSGYQATSIAMPDVKGKKVAQAQKQLLNKGLQVTVVGNGTKIKAQSVPAKSSLISSARVVLLTAGTKQMPDITGWSRSDVVALQDILGITIKTSGSGYVAKQSVKAGTNLAKVKQIEVKLK